jgi:hypothetical protein
LALPATASAAPDPWYAEYFSNRYLADEPTLSRYDDTLHFDWGTGSPGVGITADNFSVRWTRDAWFDAGTYRFSYRSDDGIRIWIGDTLIVDDWRDHPADWSVVNHVVSRGMHSVRVEYYEHRGGAAIQVTWERVNSGDSWRAEYFNNSDLSGQPILTRYDPAIDFDWYNGSPDASVPGDDFSVRWTRTLDFNPGLYRFYASCDDGVRIYVGDHLIVDTWYDQKLPNSHLADIRLGSGQHTIVVEYYDHSGEANAHVWWSGLGTFSH